MVPESVAISLLKSSEEFPVNLDDAWQWVGYFKKQEAKNKLLHNFIEDKDFSRKQVKTPTGGRPSELIMMTVDCFKSFCMMAGTAKGREIREYFLDCERQLKKLQQGIAPKKIKLPNGLLNLVARIEQRGEELHTAHHRLMSDVRELVEVIRTTYNQDAREEFCDLLRLAAEQIEKAVAIPHSPKLIEQAFIMGSTQTGCIERYTSKKVSKSGAVVVYPKINALTRDKSIDEDWNWRYKYSVQDANGNWKARSKSVRLDKLPAVRAAIALDATLPTILRLID